VKKINKVLLLGMILFGINNIFADDIWFISPQNGQNVSGSMKLQIQPPYNNIDVRVWIESDMGWERTVWSGTLNTKNNYTMTINTSKFKPGKYEAKAEFYVQGNDFDGDVTFWVGANSGNSDNTGQYFPQQ